MADFPGMGSGINRPLPSNDPVIPPNLIDPAMMQQVRNMLSTEQMKQLASHDTQEKFERVVEKMLTSLVTQSLDKMDKTPSGHTQLARLAAVLSAQHTDPGVAAASILHGPSAQPPTRTGPPSPSGPDQSLKAAYQEGRGVTMGSLGHRAAGAIAGQISQHAPNWNVEEETGDLVHYTGQVDENNNPIEADRIKTTDHNYGRTLRRVRMAQSAVAGLTNASEGGSLLTGRLGMAAGKAAGYAGIAVTAIQQTGKQLETQRQKASTYRADFGNEGTGMFAARDRFGEFMAGLGGFGTTGSARAKEDYRAASAMGLRGDQRGAATDFSSDMYMKYGMGSGDAMQIVQQALETGNVSLSDYADSIQKVTKAAVDGGRNATEAIKDLTAAQAVLASRLSGGSSSLGVATNLATATAGMDRETRNAFGGAQGLAGAVTDQRNIMFAASISGQNPMEALLASQAPGQQGVVAAHNVLNADSGYLIQQIATMARRTPDQIRNDCKGVTAPEEQWQILTEQWAQGNPTVAEMMIRRMQLLLPQLGLDPKGEAAQSGPKAISMFFNIAGGGLTKGEDLTGGVKTSDSLTGHKYQGTMLTYSKVSKNDPGSAGVDQHNQSAFVAGGGVMGHDAAQYLDLVGKTGQGSAAIEGLLNRDTQKDLKGFTGGDIDSAKFIVKDKDGKKKTVDLPTIINNADYRAQLATGDVIVKGKGNEQKSVSEFTHVDTNGGSVTSGSGGSAASTTKVTIGFQGWAERWLKVNGPTDAERAGMPDGGSYNPDQTPAYGGTS